MVKGPSPWRPKPPKPPGWHPREALRAGPAAMRRVGPTRPRARQAARPRAKPRARGRLQRVTASQRAPEARLVYGVPAARGTWFAIHSRCGSSDTSKQTGSWQGNIASGSSSNKKRGRVVTSSERASATGFGQAAASELCIRGLVIRADALYPCFTFFQVAGLQPAHP